MLLLLLLSRADTCLENARFQVDEFLNRTLFFNWTHVLHTCKYISSIYTQVYREKAYNHYCCILKLPGLSLRWSFINSSVSWQSGSHGIRSGFHWSIERHYDYTYSGRNGLVSRAPFPQTKILSKQPFIWCLQFIIRYWSDPIASFRYLLLRKSWF